MASESAVVGCLGTMPPSSDILSTVLYCRISMEPISMSKKNTDMILETCTKTGCGTLASYIVKRWYKMMIFIGF